MRGAGRPGQARRRVPTSSSFPVGDRCFDTGRERGTTRAQRTSARFFLPALRTLAVLVGVVGRGVRAIVLWTSRVGTRTLRSCRPTPEHWNLNRHPALLPHSSSQAHVWRRTLDSPVNPPLPYRSRAHLFVPTLADTGCRERGWLRGGRLGRVRVHPHFLPCRVLALLTSQHRLSRRGRHWGGGARLDSGPPSGL